MAWTQEAEIVSAQKLAFNEKPERSISLRKYISARSERAEALNEATCTWEGCLPPRHYNNPVYSCKVFLGGVPWDITEEGNLSSRTHAFMVHEYKCGEPLACLTNLLPQLRVQSQLQPGPSSPFTFKNSTISSGSSHLVSHRVSPLLPQKGSVDGSTGPGQDTLSLFKHLKRQAKLHKKAAALNEATCTWEGCLPPRHYNNPVYSCKVFLGGVPWDITEAHLLKTFSVFGPLNVDWPGKDCKWPHRPVPGYVYLLFDAEMSVKMLLRACSQQSDDNLEFYYTLSSRKIHDKKVQVIPWVISDDNFIHCPNEHPCHRNTVFVSALHGLLNAEGLAQIMEDLFGRVVYAGLYTDKHKYPIGSGRVIFRSESSYLKAVSAVFVQIKTSTVMKKIQIDPYLHYSVCQICNSQPGLFFCRAEACFKYYCQSCWYPQHSLDMLSSHQPIMCH